MSQGIKIWKLSLLLLFGLYVFLYVVVSTAVNIYYLSDDPVLGVAYNVDATTGRVFVEHVVPGGPAARAGIRENDFVLRINDIDIRRLSDEDMAHRHISVGKEVSVVIQRDGQQRVINFLAESRSAVYKSSIFTSLLPGILFCYSLCLIGLFVFLKKIEDGSARIFFMMVLCWALAMWNVFASGDALHKFLPSWFRWTSVFYWVMAVGLLVHFALIFPVQHPGFKKHRTAYLCFLYGPVALLIASILFADYPSMQYNNLMGYFWGVWFSVNFYLLVRALLYARRKTDDPHVAKQANIMLWGTAVTLLLPIGLVFLPRIFLRIDATHDQRVLLPAVLWPVTLGYAIVKHRFMNIDFIVRRGVSYALMSGFVVGLYFILVIGLGNVIPFLTGTDNRVLTILVTLVIAVLFSPVNNRIQAFVERRFFPSKFTYREAIQDFGHQLVNVVDFETLQTKVKQFLVEELGIQPLVLLWRSTPDDDLTVRDSQALVLAPGSVIHHDDAILSHMQERLRLLDLSLYRRNQEERYATSMVDWAAMSAEILLPLVAKGNVQGVLVLGGKADGDSFYKEEIGLLQSLNDQINISLANALLTEELREQARLKKELEVARRIQVSSLPQADPDVPGLDISGVSVPATEVGGDYYDYLTFSDGRFGVVVGDVSGKGTSAALYMSQLKGILNTASRFHKSLTKLITEVNRVAFENIEGQAFITLSCGAFDLKKRAISLVRAGHLPLIHYSKKLGKCKEILPRGIGVGLDRGDIFGRELQELKVPFAAGDAFVFYSDGVTEARNRDGDEFQINEIINCVERNGILPAHELRDNIMAAVAAFVGEIAPVDDMTLVVVKVL